MRVCVCVIAVALSPRLPSLNPCVVTEQVKHDVKCHVCFRAAPTHLPPPPPPQHNSAVNIIAAAEIKAEALLLDPPLSSGGLRLSDEFVLTN